MPLHDVGYRGWNGEKTNLQLRWITIATTGFRMALRSTWLNRTLILAVVPALVFGLFFFLFEQSIVQKDLREFIGNLVLLSGAPSELQQLVQQNPEEARPTIWAALVLLFFRYPQSFALVVIVGMIAPRLISADLRNKGYLLYFSRPIYLFGYICGKAATICAFMACITTLPACVLYVVGLSLSPDLNALMGTWDIPLRIAAASIVLMIPVSSVALACSAVGGESRYAAFSWFAIWVVGWVSYSVLRVGEVATSGRRNRFEGRPMDTLMEQSRWEILSPFHCLGRMQQYVFGLYPETNSIAPFFIMAAVVTILSLSFVAWQIRRRLRA